MKGRSLNLQELVMRRSDLNASDDAWDAALVCPGLYVGSLRAALDVENLNIHNITSVLTVAAKLSVCLPETIGHTTVEIIDHPAADILDVLPVALAFIDKVILDPIKHDQSIIVHCASGISRSVSVCCAWLMTREHLTYEDSLQLIRQNRPLAMPNLGFHAQLNILSDLIKTQASTKDVIKLARDTYKAKLGGQTVMDALFTQRTYANELHSSVDEIEEAIKQEPCLRACEAGRLTAWHQQLIALLQELSGEVGVNQSSISTSNSSTISSTNSSTTTSGNREGVLVDRPAAMVRQGARTKALRLLEEINQALQQTVS